MITEAELREHMVNMYESQKTVLLEQLRLINDQLAKLKATETNGHNN